MPSSVLTWLSALSACGSRNGSRWRMTESTSTAHFPPKCSCILVYASTHAWSESAAPELASGSSRQISSVSPSLVRPPAPARVGKPTANRLTSASATFVTLPPTAMKRYFITHSLLEDVAPPLAPRVPDKHQEQVEHPREEDALEEPPDGDDVVEVA